MKFDAFRKKYAAWPVIRSEFVVKDSGEDPQAVRNQLNRWVTKGYLISWRKGIYSFSTWENPGAVSPNPFYLANFLYEPSYISVESALSFYGMIPEKVSAVTSVTTKKTLALKSRHGRFTYQHVKESAFRGFVRKKAESGVSFFVAEPEKAVLDFIYLNLAKFPDRARDMLAGSYRFQEIRAMDAKRLMGLAVFYSSRKLLRLAEDVAQWVMEERT